MRGQHHHQTEPTHVGRRSLLKRSAATAAVASAGALIGNRERVSAAPFLPGVATGEYYSVVPYRCYDSRWSSAVAEEWLQLGPLTTGSTRSILVWASFDNTGATLTAILPVEPGIVAVTYNVTVTATVGTGHLRIGPRGSAPTAVHITWFGAGQTLANAGTTGIDPGEMGDVQQIDVVAGGPPGSSTHFIVDITGYYYKEQLMM